MNCYIGVYAKRGRINPDLDLRIRHLAVETLFDWEEPILSSSLSMSGRSALYLFSNHGDTLIGPDAESGEQYPYAFTNTGYISNPPEGLYEDGCRREQVGRAGGVFSLCVHDRLNDELRAYVNHMRLENVFYAENQDYYLVSTRALLLHMLIEDRPRPSIDRRIMFPYLWRGYISSPGTAFEGVREIPLYSELKINSSGLALSPIGQPPRFTAQVDGAMLDDLAQALLDAVRGTRPFLTNPLVDLTGGRDSRLLLAALIKSGISVRARTLGSPDSADAVAAARLARFYGIEHTVMRHEELSEGYIEMDLLARAQRMAFATDCMLYAAERCVAGYGVPYTSDEVSLHGLGGEVLRGGYIKGLRYQTLLPGLQARRYIYRTCERSNDFFLPGANAEYHRAALEYLGDCSPFTAEAMDYLYVNERMGKWGGPLMRCWAMSRRYVLPLSDEQLIQKVMSIRTKDKINGQINFELIRRMDDRLLSMPLALDRWAFESKGPRKGDEEGYQAREPIGHASAEGGFSYRMAALTDLKESMKAVIFDPSCSEVFTVLNRQKIEDLFSGRAPGSRSANASFAWHIYSLCVMLEGSWYRTHGTHGGGFAQNAEARQTAKIRVPE